MKRIAGIFLIALFTLGVCSAQTKNDAILLYNSAIGLMKTNAVQAIDSIELCIKICDQIGDSAASVKETAIAIAPEIYYQKAYTLYSVEKKIPESLQASKEAMMVAEKFTSDKTKDKLNKLMALAYNNMAVGYLKANDAANAVKAFDSLFTINPENYKALYNKSIAYSKLNDNVKYVETIDLFIEKAKEVNDTDQISKVQNAAMAYLKSVGNKANKANKLTDALDLFTTASKYGNDKDLYYSLANVQNKRKQYDEALSNAQKGLEMETGTPEAKAKYNWEIAEAYNGKNEVEKACNAYKEASFGAFVEGSKAQRTNLKCPGADPAPAPKK